MTVKNEEQSPESASQHRIVAAVTPLYTDDPNTSLNEQEGITKELSASTQRLPTPPKSARRPRPPGKSSARQRASAKSSVAVAGIDSASAYDEVQDKDPDSALLEKTQNTEKVNAECINEVDM